MYHEKLLRLRKNVEDHSTELAQTQRDLTAGKIGFSEKEQRLRQGFDNKFREAQEVNPHFD